MGRSSSYTIFEAFITALEWIAIHRLRASSVLHIIDIFFILFVADTKQKCQSDLTIFLSMYQFHGILIAEKRLLVLTPR